MYADDVTLTTDTLLELGRTVETTCEWAETNGMSVNMDKTVGMKFCVRGGLNEAEKNLCESGRFPIRMVKQAELLGFTIQPQLVFSEHIRKVKRKCVAAFASKGDIIGKLSLKTGKWVFKNKYEAIISYGLSTFAPFLTAGNLTELDAAKTRFLKRFLCAPVCTNNAVVYQLCEETPIGWSIMDKHGVSPSERDAYSARTPARPTADEKYLNGPAFKHNHWKGCNPHARWEAVGLTVHGFHYLLCKTKGFHVIDPNCVCRVCNREIGGLDHFFNCGFAGWSSLRQLVGAVVASFKEVGPNIPRSHCLS